MIAVLITAIPGIIAGLFNRWLFLAALFAIIPIIYLVNRFSVIIKWNLVEGIIEDVTLVNDFNQPYTEAHIIFKTKDNMEHECRFTIGHYGDYEEGIEPDDRQQDQQEREVQKAGQGDGQTEEQHQGGALFHQSQVHVARTREQREHKGPKTTFFHCRNLLSR